MASPRKSTATKPKPKAEKVEEKVPEPEPKPEPKPASTVDPERPDLERYHKAQVERQNKRLADARDTQRRLTRP